MSNLPPVVPVLKPEMICKGFFTHPTIRNCHCLGGWCNKVSRAGTAIFPALSREINYQPLTTWNDQHTSEECADLWNRTMETLGYTRDGDHFVLAEGGGK
jgi:hypothetical protein